MRRATLLILLAAICWPLTQPAFGVPDGNPGPQPNVVLIVTDDQGYGDVGCYGATHLRTPHLDRLAAAGVRFTDFYAAQATCTSSRAAILTGCYPNRIGLVGALNHTARDGIHPQQTTLAELAGSRGYRTALVGKWHLGHLPAFLPLRHGFDEFFGLPYSHDMWPGQPMNRNFFPDLPLYDGDRVIEKNPDVSQLTQRYTQRALRFIDENAQKPFFLVLAHSMPHVPLESRKHSNPPRAYADVIEEIDDSVGQIVAALKRRDLDKRTLVIFTSDNGPWLLYGDHGGSAGLLREGKATTFEGGVRVPCIMCWPGRLPAGRVVRSAAMNIDLLPTVAEFMGAGGASPPKVDGRSLVPVLTSNQAVDERSAPLYFYWLKELQALRAGRWKLHLPHRYPHVAQPGRGGTQGKYEFRTIGLELFDLEADPGESINVAEKHPDVVERLSILAKLAQVQDQAAATAP